MSGNTVVQLNIHASRGHPIKLTECQDDVLYNIRITAAQVEKNTSLSVKKEVQLKIIRGSDCITVSAEDHDKVYYETDFFVFSTSTIDLSSLVFKLDVYNNYNYSSDSVTGNIGHGFVSSPQMSGSSGSLMVVLVNDSSQYVGSIAVEYLLIHPWNHPLNLPRCQQTRHKQGINGMKKDGQPYLCGHRGAGESFNSPTPSIYPENTISAFKAANKQGIDFVEMDVQVSKDKIPVVFHDTTVKLCLQASVSNPDDCCSTYLEVPVKDLTLEQMQNSKVFGIIESIAYQNARNSITKLNDPGCITTNNTLHRLKEDFKLFSTLKQVFDEVPEETGLLLELKYPLEELGGENIDYQCMDENEFVDAILQAVYDNARGRKVILASFDANICSMCEMKQSLFPVLFITQDNTTVFDPYVDLRTRHIDIAIGIAKAQTLDGLHTFSDELLKSPEKIDKVLGADLILSVWGGVNDDPEKRAWLQARGVHCIQIDNIFGLKQNSEAS